MPAMTAAAPPDRLADVLRQRGDISREQLDHLLIAAGFRGHTEAVLATLDPGGRGRVDPDALLDWLYAPAGKISATSNFQSRQLRDVTANSLTSNPNVLSPRLSEVGASPRLSAYGAEHVERMKQFMEVPSTLRETIDEYNQMAQMLADDFLSRGKNPQAEAFIEQVCVEKILEGCLFVGHIKTDLDSVAGAIGAACLWRGVATRAEREFNGEIAYALKFAGMDPPPFFDDVLGAVTPDASGKLLNVCLVDHNEEKQMTSALRKDPQRSKRICGLIDHHCLSESFSSEKPVFMDIRPWGSMSTIVAHSFIRSNRPMPKHVARILLAAILSDTLNLQSVTATTADQMMVTLLSIVGDVDDVEALAHGMFRAKTEWIVNLGAYEMTRGDQKDFTCCGWKIGIAVLEVTDSAPVLSVADQLLLELRILKIEKGRQVDGAHDRRKELDFSYLFVVDVAQQKSVLLICGGRELALANAAFPGCALRMAKPGLQAPGEIINADQTLLDVGPIVSRKAQFVPAFFQALSDDFKCHKHPMSELSEEMAKQEPEDEVFKAMRQMSQMSYHDSVQVVRDYTEITKAFERKGTTGMDDV